MIWYLIIFGTDLFVGIGAIPVQQIGIMHLKLRSEGKVCGNGFCIDKKSCFMLASRTPVERLYELLTSSELFGNRNAQFQFIIIAVKG